MVALDGGELVFNVGTPGDIVIPVSCSLYASSTMIDRLFPGENSVAFAEGFVVTDAVNGFNFCVVGRDCFVPASMSLETSASDMFGTYFLGTIKMSEQSQIFINRTKADVLAQYKIVDRMAHIDAGVSEYVSYSLDEFVEKYNNGDLVPYTIFDSSIVCGLFDFERDESIEINCECAWVTVQCSDGSLDLLAFSNGWD